MKYFILLVLTLAISLPSIAQKDIDLGDIWTNNTFRPKSVPGFNFLKDGRHYTRLENNIIKKYDITTGSYVEDIFDASVVKGMKGFDSKMDGFTFNSDESKILIESKSYDSRSFHLDCLSVGSRHNLIVVAEYPNIQSLKELA